MTEHSLLVREFERHRPYLRAVALRMLGSSTEADDALQEAWLRLDRRPPARRDDLRPWLTTVVGRICLDMLRARRRRREEPAGTTIPEPIVVTDFRPAASSAAERSPEQEVELADSVGLALLVVLEALSPAERLAFVLHDVFAVPFEQIATVVDRSPEAARQLASRARRRVRAARAEPDADIAVQRRIVDAFLMASREGRFDELLALLDPDVTLRIDAGARPTAGFPDVLVRATRTPVAGSERVIEVLRTGAPMFAPWCRPALVNGSAGLIVGPPGRVFGVVRFRILGGRIREIQIVSDPDKLRAVG
jgi:RNA polymerase sigma factor (sigma-70 family)